MLGLRCGCCALFSPPGLISIDVGELPAEVKNNPIMFGMLTAGFGGILLNTVAFFVSVTTF